MSAIVGGFFIIGSPQTQRLIRFDQDKINDLSSIQWQIVNFYQQKERLPETLEELEDPLIGFILPQDSQTEVEYGYVRVEDLKFQLCADFNKESRGYSTDDPRVVKIASSPYGYGFEDENWTHGEGETCFERTIEKGELPACVDACPIEAIVFGTRRELIELAHERIRTHPDRYVDHIYGEHEYDQRSGQDVF